MNRTCFPLPDLTAQTGSDGVVPFDLPESASLLGDLAGMTSRELHALSRLIPGLLCGEESAVNVFHHHSAVATSEAIAHAFQRIVLEESGHEVALRHLSRHLPTPDDRHQLRKISQNFFISIRSPDPAVQFVRIAELDASVCTILLSLTQRRCVLQATGVLAILRRIHVDEAKHVAICRRYIDQLNLRDEVSHAEGLSVRNRVADMMVALGDAYEDLGIDLDQLSRRIRRNVEAAT